MRINIKINAEWSANFCAYNLVVVSVVGDGGGGGVALFYLSFVIRYSFVPVTNILVS